MRLTDEREQFIRETGGGFADIAVLLGEVDALRGERDAITQESVATMTPEQREQFIDAAAPAYGASSSTVAVLDLLTLAGFSISLDSVRDHTRCGGRTACIDGTVCGHVIPCPPDRLCSVRVPCPGGSPVVWSAEA